MRLRVKICGITNGEDARIAVEEGADALGFILYPKSPRYVTPQRAQEIIARLPPYIERTAVMVNPTGEEIHNTAEQADFSLWQLHGHETPEFCRELGRKRLVKALSLPTTWTTKEIISYPVTAFLLDSPSQQYGGTGQTFDWSLVEGFKGLTPLPLILSGGLNPRNVAEAVKRVQPYGVDVSSGVESSPGRKDATKIQEFLRVCKSL